MLGNLAGAREWLHAKDPPGDYDWFGASRVIEDTINEIPSFSFTLGDLHAHVLAIPFTLLALAFALQVALAGPRGDVAWRSVAEALAAGLAVGVLYAINSWSYPVVAGLLVAAVVVWMREPTSAGRRAYGVVWTVLVVLGGIVLTLPFWLNFDAAARGIGRVTEHDSFAHWAGDQALIYGDRRLAGGRGLREPRARHLAAAAHRRCGARWRPRSCSRCWRPSSCRGSRCCWRSSRWRSTRSLSTRLVAAERFLWVLLAGAAGCVLLPELIYVRDEFDGSDAVPHEHRLQDGLPGLPAAGGSPAACALPWAGRWLPRRAWAGWATVTTVLVLLGLVYPYAGNYARREGFSRSPTLDGLGWLRESAPGDVEAIAWLRDNAPDDAVVLEAVGPDYSGFGHARMSTFTGRADGARMGRPRGPVDARPGHAARPTCKTMYTTTDPATVRPLLDRYGVELRRRRADRARRLRRRRAGQVGRPRPPRVRPRRHRRCGYWGSAARRM